MFADRDGTHKKLAQLEKAVSFYSRVQTCCFLVETIA
jgi:hypothetical protein